MPQPLRQRSRNCPQGGSDAASALENDACSSSIHELIYHTESSLKRHRIQNFMPYSTPLASIWANFKPFIYLRQLEIIGANLKPTDLLKTIVASALFLRVLAVCYLHVSLSFPQYFYFCLDRPFIKYYNA
jgi:hypothetical protein